MTIKDIIDTLALEIKVPAPNPEREVSGGYASDLLSDVIANTKEGSVWITFQVHMNILAVASLKGLAGIILVNNRTPDEATLKRATDEQIPIMTTPLTTFEVVGRLYALGLRCP